MIGEPAVAAEILAAFERAATEPDPILPFVTGMRAVCAGAEAGVLPAADAAALVASIEAARPVLLGLASAHALDTERQASPYLWCLDPRHVLGKVQQTLGLVMAWATPLDARATWHPGFLAGYCAFIRLQANSLESVVWSERAMCGVFHQPEQIREQAMGLVVEQGSTADAGLSRPSTRH